MSEERWRWRTASAARICARSGRQNCPLAPAPPGAKLAHYTRGKGTADVVAVRQTGTGHVPTAARRFTMLCPLSEHRRTVAGGADVLVLGTSRYGCSSMYRCRTPSFYLGFLAIQGACQRVLTMCTPYCALLSCDRKQNDEQNLISVSVSWEKVNLSQCASNRSRDGEATSLASTALNLFPSLLFFPLRRRNSLRRDFVSFVHTGFLLTNIIIYTFMYGLRLYSGYCWPLVFRQPRPRFEACNPVCLPDRFASV
jgi:hypothetical protein